MKRLCMLAAAGAALVSLADVTVIPVSTKQELIAALGQYKSTSYEIQLAPGVYQFEDDDCMEREQYAGPSHLLVSNVRLVGMGDVPEDVELCGSGMMRVIRANSPVVIANLKISGGHAKKVEGASYSSDNCGGGVSGSCTLTNCIVTQCHADRFGGGVRNYTVLQNCTISDCTAGESGGGAYEPGIMRGCTVRNCTAAGSGGGVYGRAAVPLYDCLIENNKAETGLGGGLIAATATNCIIRGNVAAVGGAFGGWAKDPALSPELYNCHVYNNRATDTYGGGVIACRMIGGELYGNYSKHGGGAAWYDNRPMYLIGVNVHDNYATSYGGGAHGAVFSNCTISANMCSATGTGNQGYACKYYDCTLTKTDGEAFLAVDCTFTDVGGDVTLDNQIYRDLNAGQNLAKNIQAIGRGNPVCTNCLFVGNLMNSYSSRLWFGVSGSANSPIIVNCTIVSNRYGGVMNYVKTVENPAKVENCVFFGNMFYDGNSQVDISGWESGTTLPEALKFHNCAYGKAAHLFAGDDLAKYCDGPMYKYGADGFPADPGFNFGSAYEFEPKRKSPLRGLGVFDPEKVIEYDIRGPIDGGKYRRVRDGKIDLGCYQCWLPTPPTALFIR